MGRTFPDVLRSATGAEWIATARADLDSVYRDHLHCERKAAQSALSLVKRYPERVDLVDAMGRLAHEETRHVVQVSRLLRRRGLTPSRDTGDDYAQRLRAEVRRGEPERLLDMLLVGGLIEARSAERLALIADAVDDPEVAGLYAQLAEAEVRHRDLFLGLATEVMGEAEHERRLAELAEREAVIVAELPVRARIH